MEKILLKIREDCFVFFEQNAVVFDGVKRFRIKECKSEEIDLIKNLVSGVYSSELNQYGDLIWVVKYLVRHEVLLTLPDNPSRDEIWLSHFVRDARSVLLKLSELTVMIIGCGGTGSVVSELLVRAGVRKYILIDKGKVDAPDFNRQLPYRPEHLGKFKVDVLDAYLKSVEPNCEIERLKLLVEENSIDSIVGRFSTHPVTLLISCADEPRENIDRTLVRLSTELSCAVLFGSVGIDDYVVGPLLCTISQKYRYLNALERARRRANYVISGSNCFVNTLASVRLAQLCYSFLTGQTNESHHETSWLYHHQEKGRVLYSGGSTDDA